MRLIVEENEGEKKREGRRPAKQEKKEGLCREMSTLWKNKFCISGKQKIEKSPRI